MIKIVVRNEKYKPMGFRMPESRNFDGNGELTIDFDDMSAELSFTATDNKEIIRNTSMFITHFGLNPTMETIDSGTIVLFNFFMS